MHCFAYLLLFEKYKQFVNGVHFDLKECVKYCFMGP